jgi:hypothetical protein
MFCVMLYLLHGENVLSYVMLFSSFFFFVVDLLQIDANSDGSITWDEFSTYMMLENSGSMRIRERELLIEFVRSDKFQRNPLTDAHRDSILSMCKVSSSMGLSDKYVTVGKDGAMKIWMAKDFSLVKTVPEEETKFRRSPCWTVAVCLTPRTNKIITAVFRKALRIYDSNNFERLGSQDTDHAPLCLTAFYSERIRREFIAVGDVNGYVSIYSVEENSYADDKGGDRWCFSRLWRQTIRRYKTSVAEESKWVSSITYLEGTNPNSLTLTLPL